MSEIQEQLATGPLFGLLATAELQARRSAVGVPRTEKIQEIWTGIGFQLGGYRLIVDIDIVGEMLPVPPMSVIPGVQSWVKGIANIRGTLLPIIDLQASMGGAVIDMGPRVRVLVVNKPGLAVGFLIDDLFGARHLPVEQSSNDASTGAEWLDPWLVKRFSDKGTEWRQLDLAGLLADGSVLGYSE